MRKIWLTNKETECVIQNKRNADLPEMKLNKTQRPRIGKGPEKQAVLIMMGVQTAIWHRVSEAFGQQIYIAFMIIKIKTFLYQRD